MVAALMALSLALAARGFWDLKGRVWFWSTLTLMFAFHTFLIVWIPWPRLRWSGYAFVPFFILHQFLTRGVFTLIERLMRLFERKEK